MKTFFRLLNFSKPYSSYLPKYIVFVLFYIIFGLMNFTLLIPLLDILFNSRTFNHVENLPNFSFSLDYFKDTFYYYLGYQIEHGGKFSVLLFVSITIVITVVLKNLFGYLSQRVLGKMRSNLVKKIREAIFKQFSTQSLAFFSNEKKGDLLSHMSGDVTEIENSVVSSIQTLFRDPLVIVATFVMLFYYSPMLTFFTLFFFPISGLIISTISKRLKRKAESSQHMLGSIISTSEETISGIRVVKAFNAEGFVQKKFGEENNSFTKLMRSTLNQRELASPMSEVLGVIVIVIIIIYGGYLILNEKSSLTASEFIAYIAFYFQIISPAKSISNAISTMQRGLAAGDRVFRLIDAPDPIIESPNPTTIKAFNNKISFKQVDFSYQEKAVLKNLNFDIEKGKMIALVGPSGAGKSTLADLIPRFYDIKNGEILLDGIAIKNIRLADLRKQIAIVGQEAILFNDSVFNNIAFGMDGVTVDAVTEAAKVAFAHDFIMQLPNGYDTKIGDRGNTLSGGQRQRLTIARAVLKNAPILILDEATSALDSESEKAVQSALNNLMKDKTSIVIAHRLSTIQHADKIFVMQHGEIVQTGNHAELMQQQGGLYQKLVELQSF